MTIPRGFVRCSIKSPCPVCGKPTSKERRIGWCLINAPEGKVYCGHVEIGCERDRFGNAIELSHGMGFLHRITPGAAPATREYQRPEEPPPDFAAVVERLTSQAPPIIGYAAQQLGVTPTALMRMQVGYTRSSHALAFPMRTDAGKIVGVRFRAFDGRKWAAKGSRNGIFLPTRMRGAGPVLVPEGPTDAAAIIDLGFDVIGRPFDRGGIIDLRRWFRLHQRPAVVVADVDAPGIAAARKVAGELAEVTTVRIIAPTRGKDARAWRQLGADHDEIERVISMAQEIT